MLLTLKLLRIILSSSFKNETKGVIELKNTKRRHTPYTKFKAYMQENGINQRDLADLLGKSPSALNQNLNGTGGDFSLAEIRIICLKFGISSDEYFLHPGVSNTKLQSNVLNDARNETSATSA